MIKKILRITILLTITVMLLSNCILANEELGQPIDDLTVISSEPIEEENSVSGGDTRLIGRWCNAKPTRVVCYEFFENIIAITTNAIAITTEDVSLTIRFEYFIDNGLLRLEYGGALFKNFEYSITGNKLRLTESEQVHEFKKVKPME